MINLYKFMLKTFSHSSDDIVAEGSSYLQGESRVHRCLGGCRWLVIHRFGKRISCWRKCMREAWPSDWTNCNFSKCCQCGAAIRKVCRQNFWGVHYAFDQRGAFRTKASEKCLVLITMSRDVTASSQSLNAVYSFTKHFKLSLVLRDIWSCQHLTGRSCIPIGAAGWVTWRPSSR